MTTISTLPPAPQPTDDTSTFNSKAFALLAALAGFVTEANAQAGENNTAASTATTGAATATTKAAEAAATLLSCISNALAAAASAGAAAWVSGTTYAAGAVVWSPADSRIYRRRAGMGGAGTTDPSLDVTNWMLASGGSWGVPTLLTVANNGQTLAANALYHLDSVGGSFSLSMPVMAVGDWIKLVDVSGKLGLNPVTITRNATNGNLAGYAEDRILDSAFDSVEMVKTSSYGVIEQ